MRQRVVEHLPLPGPNSYPITSPQCCNEVVPTPCSSTRGFFFSFWEVFPSLSIIIVIIVIFFVLIVLITVQLILQGIVHTTVVVAGQRVINGSYNLLIFLSLFHIRFLMPFTSVLTSCSSSSFPVSISHSTTYCNVEADLFWFCCSFHMSFSPLFMTLKPSTS